METLAQKPHLITTVLSEAVEHRATDIHIICGLPVMYRIAGDLVPLDESVLCLSEARNLCYSFLSEDQIKKFELELDMDLIKTLGQNRFRVNLSFNDGNVGAVISNS